MLDFGLMGKWSKETLMEKASYLRHFNGLPIFLTGELKSIYDSKVREINLEKKLWKLNVLDILSIIDDKKHNDQLEKDWNEMWDFIKNNYEKEDEVNVS